jgi:fused signal recognition particle receptor
VGVFARLASRFGRTRAAIGDGISGLFKGGRKIDGALLAELEELLWTSDLGPIASELCEELTRLHRRGELHGEDDVRSHLRSLLSDRLDSEAPATTRPSSGPMIILVVGVNGSGKTTSIAKLAHHFKAQGKSVLLGASDTFRAAAADQLEVWAERNGARIVRSHADGADPAAVAFDAAKAGQGEGCDVVIIDTAGRLHTQKNLLDELEKVRRVLGKAVEGAPHETWLVIDATNGQNAIQQAREFTSAVEVTGLVLAKLDGTARGGAVFGIREALGLPVRFVGTGEGLEDLAPFDPAGFIDAIVPPSSTEGPQG